MAKGGCCGNVKCVGFLGTKVWTQLPNQDIPPLTEHGCLFYENELFIFGGITTENKRINSLYKYSFGKQILWEKKGIIVTTTFFYFRNQEMC